MTRYILGLSGLMALFIGLSGGTKAADEPKTKAIDEPKTKPPAAPESTAPSYITVGDIVGEVLKVDDKSITVRVTWYTTPPVKMPKGGNNGNWNHGSSGRNPQAMYQHQMMMQQKMQQQLAKAQSKAASQAKEQHKDYVMDFATDAQARVKHLQPKLDDKGKQTNYSPDELQKLRGNPLVPGYIVELSMIKVGQIVEAHLVHAPKEKDFIVRWALILNEKGKSTTTASTSTLNKD